MKKPTTIQRKEKIMKKELNFGGNTTTTTEYYRVTVEGHTYKLDYNQAQKVVDYIRSLTNQAPTASKMHDVPANKSVNSKKEFKEVDLGKALATTGCCARFKSNNVRYWGVCRTTEAQRGAIKNSLRIAGASWDENYGAFHFTTKKACDEWWDKQVAYNKKWEKEHKNK